MLTCLRQKIVVDNLPRLAYNATTRLERVANADMAELADAHGSATVTSVMSCFFIAVWAFFAYLFTQLRVYICRGYQFKKATFNNCYLIAEFFEKSPKLGFFLFFKRYQEIVL